MKSVIVIPARFNSTRLPGKPLVLINGKSLIYRTWLIAKSVKNIDEVYITTDDHRIEEHALEFGAKVIMTLDNCENGTERIYKAIVNSNLSPEIIINLQGDAVLTPPWVIQSLLDEMMEDNTIGLTTLATKMSREQCDLLIKSKNSGDVGGTTVVFDKNKNALYFSKAIIPFVRNKNSNDTFTYRHIGLYGYRYPTLEKYISLSPTTLEKSEGLEQLRALENGIPIRIVTVDYKGRTHWAVDSPEDVKTAEKLISIEGELILQLGA